MVSDKKRRWRRKNGLSWPLDPLQLVAWFFTFLFALVYFGIMIPSIPMGICQLVSIYIMVTFLGIHCVLHVTCNIVDPGDVDVRSKKQVEPLPVFNRHKHSQVIENQYCHICEVKVTSSSKHCGTCNKCIEGFDHHCKWLNNCVGKRNYRLFLACITTALISSLLLIILSVICTVHATTTVSWPCSSHQEILPSNSSAPFPNNSSTIANWQYLAFVPVTKQIWLAIVLITLILAIVAFALLAHLLGFHLYLVSKGYSTYEYILRQRELDDENNVDACKLKKRGQKCSLSQSNKKVSPQPPNAPENGKPSRQANAANIHKFNGVAQTRKENFSINKEGLCSSGDVYIGSPSKAPNDSTLSPKLHHEHHNGGFTVDSMPKSEEMWKEEVPINNHLKDSQIVATHDNRDQTAKEDPMETLISRSPSLNNLMMDNGDDENDNQEFYAFDNLENCKEVDSGDRLISSAPNELEMQEKYVHHSNDSIGNNNNCVETKIPANDADDTFEVGYGLTRSSNHRGIPNGRSQSVDIFDCPDKTSDIPQESATKRRCSVEVHNLCSEQNHVSSLTPVDSTLHQIDHKRRQSNLGVLQSIRDHIV